MNPSPSTVSPVTSSTPLVTALISLCLQGLGLAGIAIWLVWLSVTAESTSAGAGFAEAAIAAGVAALLFGAAKSMYEGRPGMRGLAVFLQLMLAVAGYYLAQADWWTPALIAWAWAIVTACGMLAPTAREALGVGVDRDDSDVPAED